MTVVPEALLAAAQAASELDPDLTRATVAAWFTPAPESRRIQVDEIRRRDRLRARARHIAEHMDAYLEATP